MDMATMREIQNGIGIEMRTGIENHSSPGI
jgi:hypothetical protein